MASEQDIQSAAIMAATRPSTLSGRIYKGITNFIKRKPLGAVGAGIILVMIVLALAAAIITSNDPLKMHFRDALQSPNGEYWLGTDDFGRDMWSRIVYGAQISLYVGFFAIAIGSGVGGLLGLASAYYGGKVDIILQRLMDTVMSIPTLIMALAIMASLGQGLNNVVLAIGVVQIPRANRIVRSQALSVKQSEFALAAQAIGATDLRIMLLHIMPQCVAPWLIIATAGLGTAIISEASLSFLGLGIPAPEPSWGGMLSGRGRDYYSVAPWMAIWPGLAISLAVYGFNLFGDAIRDVLDPRLRGS